MPAHEGEEFVFVCNGQATLHSEHYEPLVLDPGDSVYFDSGAGQGGGQRLRKCFFAMNFPIRKEAVETHYEKE